MTDEDDIFRPRYDLGELRHAAACFCKLLIRARWRCEPGFLGRAELAAWGLDDIDDDRLPAWELLRQAALALGYLNSAFLPRCGSGGVRETDEATPEGRLISALVGLAPGWGGGPDHNAEMLDAARRLRAGAALDWAELGDWGPLGAIRADLDRLPQPRREAPGDRLGRIEALLASLAEREQVKDWYSVEEFARLVGKAEFTCREWCRLGRVLAVKKQSGRGMHRSWAVSHEELLRYRRDGLLPAGR